MQSLLDSFGLSMTVPPDTKMSIEDLSFVSVPAHTMTCILSADSPTVELYKGYTTSFG